MAKRAPILPENYNPVGERLRRLSDNLVPAEEKVLPLASQVSVVPDVQEGASEEVEERSPLREREVIPEIPVGQEPKSVSVRFRCSLNERRKWHEAARKLSGDHNNLSHFIRAMMLLLENAQDELGKLSPEIQRLRKPSSNDMLGIALFEQRLAQTFYDAIKGAGRPKA